MSSKTLRGFNFWNQQVNRTFGHSAQAILRKTGANAKGAFSRDSAAAISCGSGSCNCGGGCNGECGGDDGD